MLKRLQQVGLKKIRWFLTAGLSLLLLSGCKIEMPQQDIGYNECWPCAVYDKLYTALNQMVNTMMTDCCDMAIDLMGIGLLFWLMIHIGKFLATIQEPNLRKFIFPITTILFKTILIYSIIHNADAYINWLAYYLVQPILDGFIEISNLLLNSDELVKTATTTQAIVENNDGTESVIFTYALKYKFLKLIYKMYVALRVGTTLGSVLMAGGTLATFFFGLFVVISFWWLLLSMPLSFMDSFVRMAIMVILSPFVLVAWVFPPTAKHLKKLWGIFLGTGLVLMFSCFYLAVLTYAILTYAQKEFPAILGQARAASDPDLIEQVTSCSVGTLGFFVLILCLNRLSGLIPKLAHKFGGESAPSSYVKVLQGFKKISIGMAKLAVAAAVASPTVAKEALGDMKQAVKDTAGAAMGNNDG